MHFLSNFGCKINFMYSVNFWHQQDSTSLFKGSIGHVTSQCMWPVYIFLGQFVHVMRLVGWFLSRRKITSLTLKTVKDLLKRRKVFAGKGFPSVITSNTFCLSFLSPALELNSSFLACSRARSILVMKCLTGSIVLMFSANVNLKRLYLSNVIKPNWVFCADISNLAQNGFKNVSNKTSSFL